MFNTKRITIDLNDRVKKTVTYVENDSNDVIITLTNGDELVVSNATLQIKGDTTNEYAIENYNPLQFIFGTAIQTQGTYECRVIVRENGQRVSFPPFYATFNAEWIATQTEQEENIEIHADLYNRISQNDTELLDHENRVQLIETDLPNKLDKTTTEKQDVASVVEMLNDLIVNGNFTVKGTTTSVDTVELRIVDNLIELNKNQTGIPLSTLLSGFYVNRGDLENYYFYFDESDDMFKIGKANNLQPVATRELSPIDDGIAYWDSTTNRFITKPNTPHFTDITLQEITQPTTYGLAKIKSLQGDTQIIPNDEEIAISQLLSSGEITYINEQPYTNVSKINFNGNEGWYNYGDSTDYARFYIPNTKPLNYNNGEIHFNNTNFRKGYETDTFLVYDVLKSYLVSSGYNPDGTTTEKRTFFKNFLSQNNLIVTYQLATPRLANSTLQSVENPTIKSVGDNNESTQTIINGTYHKWDSVKIINGEYKKEKGSTDLINLWEYGSIDNTGTLTNTYVFRFNGFETTYNLKYSNLSNALLNTLSIFYNDTRDTRHITYFTNTHIYIYIEKSLIDAQTGSTLVDKLKAYLQANQIQFVGQKATVTYEDVNVNTIELYEGGTVYLTSDGVVGETVITVATNDKATIELLKDENKRQQSKIDMIINHLGI